VKHVENQDETLVFVLPLNEGEVIQSFLPPTHEYEEDFHEVHHPIETSPASILPAHENKEVVNFSHT
jgi:hypothetical protein